MTRRDLFRRELRELIEAHRLVGADVKLRALVVRLIVETLRGARRLA